MKKIKLIAICGESGSGKTTILEEVVKAAPHKFNKIIRYICVKALQYETYISFGIIANGFCCRIEGRPVDKNQPVGLLATIN